MIARYSIALLMVLLAASRLKGQQTFGGIPYTSVVNSTNPAHESYREIIQTVASTELPTYNNDELKSEADAISATTGEYFYGKMISQEIDLINSGTFQQVDGIRVYRYRFHSNTAEALQFSFSSFDLPDGGELYFYNADKTRFFGSLNNNNVPDKHEGRGNVLSTIDLEGGDWTLEYNEPSNADFRGAIVVSEVVHVFNKATATSGFQCQIDANCDPGDGWDAEKKSTVKIQYTTATGMVGLATGNFINTTNNKGGPYILTAGHYLVTNTVNTNNMRFWIKYMKDGCYNDGSGYHILSTYRIITGAEEVVKKYTATGFDYALLRLAPTSRQTLDKWSICYAGWDRTPQDPMNSLNSYPYIIFHHPEGLDLKVAQTTNQVLESVTGVPDQSINQYAGFLRGWWAEGAPVAGSNGASVFYQDKRIIGTLSTGNLAACVVENKNYVYNNAGTRFSKFSISYADGHFANYLDPDNSGASICPSFCAEQDPTTDYPEVGTGLEFNINGHATLNHITQACAGNVVLDRGYPFFLTKTAQNRSCNNISDWNYIASYQQTCTLSVCRCHSTHYRIFVSIQECGDNFWTTIGPEYGQWFWIYDGNNVTEEEANFSSLDLSVYAPLGYHLQPGKNYRIKTAGINFIPDPDKWMSYSALVSTFAQDLVLNNKYMTTTQIAAHNIDVSGNSYVPPVTIPEIQFIAGNEIRITGEADLNSGRYYIKNLNCQNINALRPAVPDSTLKLNGMFDQSAANTIPAHATNSDIPATPKANVPEKTVSVYPNPSAKEFNVLVNLKENSSVSASLMDLSGKEVKECFNYTNQKGSQVYAVTPDVVPGMYILKININGTTTNYKLIKTAP